MKVFIKTFGCRVNQVESEAVLEQYKALNHTITANFKEADICILNTCSVTHKADRDVEREIRKIIKENPLSRLIVTGCYAMVNKDRISKEFPTAQTVFKADLSKELFSTEIDWTVKEHRGHSRAFVKIQDGCDNFCSYCIVPYTRPHKSSKPKDVILKEIEGLIANGFREIVLTGINIGNYKCPSSGLDLAGILPHIFSIKGDFRVRFSSIELNTVTDALIEEAAKGKDKFCNYFHIPLQSGSDAVLKHMGRHYTTQEYFDKIQYIKSKIEGVSFFCDIIAGYPAETQEDFEISSRFLDKIAFAGLHVFSYSKRSGTPAAQMKQVPSAEIKKRADALRQKDKVLRVAFANSLIGTTRQFLAEEFLENKNLISGVAGNFQRVIVENAQKKDTLSPVKIISAKDGICFGQYV